MAGLMAGAVSMSCVLCKMGKVDVLVDRSTGAMLTLLV